MELEAQVARHYTHGSLEHAIIAALRAAGKDPDALSIDDLSELDELHSGWRPATAELAADLDLGPGLELLDVGSGLGGPARFFAQAHGCRVTGLDVTEELVQVAGVLTARSGLDARVRFLHGSALALPFGNASFDRATLIHVGMNIEDKGTLFSELRRVLRPGGALCVYDVMRLTPAPLPYPLPWAETEAASFVEPPEAYRRLLAEQGFTLERERSRREQTLELARAMRARAAAEGPPQLGLHVLMGASAAPRIANVMEAIERGGIAPIELVARVPGRP